MTDLSGNNWRLLVGDVRQRLRDLPAGSVHACITSPPYWGLRAYGTEPQVWGVSKTCGGCRHEWGEELRQQQRGIVGGNSTLEGGSQRRESETDSPQVSIQGQFCIHCNAWRGELGSEPTPDLFVAHLVEVFREVRRVLRDDGVLFVNIGDSYATNPGNGRGGETGVEGGIAHRSGTDKSRCGLKPKDLCLVPWRFAIAMQDDGWWVRDAIAWTKPAPMPESVRDRCTKAWEPIFMFTKAERYYWDGDAVKEPAIYAGTEQCFTTPYKASRAMGRKPSGNEGNGEVVVMCAGRNLRNVWTLPPSPFPDAHFAVFPPSLPERCIKAGTSERGCCPNCGAPWRRITERTALKRERPNDLTKRTGADGTGNHCANTVAGVAVQTRGWEPTCDCGRTDVVPCTVIDPFSGSGTTLMVATELGRYGIGIELNPEYAALHRKRVESWRYRDIAKQPEPMAGQKQLFAESAP